MAKFVYRMQSILNIKIQMESQAKIELGLAQRKLLEEEERLEELYNRKESYLEEGRRLRMDSLKVQSLRDNEYAVAPDAVAPGGSDKIYHFDFYRVETVEELLDMGLDDYWDSGSVCLMEWPENALGFLPDDTVDVRIEVLPDDSRMLTV